MSIDGNDDEHVCASEEAEDLKELDEPAHEVPGDPAWLHVFPNQLGDARERDHEQISHTQVQDKRVHTS